MTTVKRPMLTTAPAVPRTFIVPGALQGRASPTEEHPMTTPKYPDDAVLCYCGHFGCQHHHIRDDEGRAHHAFCHASGCGCQRYTRNPP